MKPHCKITASLFPALAFLFFSPVATSFADDKEGKPAAESAEKKAGPRDGEGDRPAGPRDGEGGRKPEGNGRAPAGGLNTKEGKVFVAYDKNRNGSISDEEIVAMIEGKQNSRGRREVSKAVERADKDQDGVLNYDEFVWWYTVGRTDERAKNRE
jgi:hypothetical protein